MKRATYTIIKRDDGTRFYRGAIRIERDTVIWECEHEHSTLNGARYCAVDYLALAPADERA